MIYLLQELEIQAIEKPGKKDKRLISMKTKIITFKPNKSGETTLFLEKGVDLHFLINLIGHEIDIMPYEELQDKSIIENAPINLIIEAIKPIIQSQLNIARMDGYKEGINKIEESETEEQWYDTNNILEKEK